MKAIGIGCFWFAAKDNGPANSDIFSSTDHLATIKDALESVDNVSDVRILGEGNSIQGISFSGGDEDQEERYFPIFTNVVIGFNIFMPARLRERYGHGRGGDDIDHYRVIVSYGYYMPVTFIYYDVDEPKANIRRLSPSDAVVFIREYLTDKLSSNAKVAFQCLGPSPFHADIFVVGHADGSTDIRAEDLSRPGDGYKRLFFEVPGKEEAEIFGAFTKKYEIILGMYYTVVTHRNQLLRLKSSVMSGVKDLFSNSKGRLASFVHKMRQGQVIDEVFESLLSEQMSRIELEGLLAEGLRDREIEAEDIFFQFLEREKLDVSPIPADEVREVLRMLEDRRQRYFGNLATLGSGLLGGLIGAVVGATLTLYLTSAPQPTPLTEQPTTTNEDR